MTKITIDRDALARLREKSKAAPTEAQITAAADSLTTAFADLENVFVNRTEEIAAVTLAVACGQHVLLEGKHGVAKSDFAREAFRRIRDVTVYDKMFSKGTNNDDVFGPILMEKFKQGIWEHNTTGALPTSHFANLEELGRASDVLLPTMMTILNERIFHNGNKVQDCPLITAIATTNFLTESDELAAFNDRWLVRMVVQPLSHVSQRAQMIERMGSPRKGITDYVTLLQVKMLNYATRTIDVEDEVIVIYAELAAAFQRAAGIDYISDRRLGAAFRLAKARAVLSGRSAVTVDDLEVVRYGLSVTGKDDESLFNGALQRVVGDLKGAKEETEAAQGFDKLIKKFQDRYDASMTKDQAKALYDECRAVLNSYAAYDKPVKLPKNQATLRETASRLGSLIATIEGSFPHVMTAPSSY